ncbi:hypothetical protein PpBr36_04063 [Pyricularia pennisetigena]|uniref:hypothetical protein n=1 Tax=Pyricularia pennisetigena TaxID=1578925 RepID=UPI0011516D74|nr:hypothetical protein PpBr36_04063 [Pyricularia pennisetigena]TLS27327.1 hypothetical protein PpBr36_04063 [Pyricularia pennisetigena]
MDALPTRLEKLDEHLDELLSNPEIPIDAALFDHVELQITEANIPHLMPRLLPKVASILRKYQNDPQVLCSLALKLLQQATLSQVLSLTSEEDLAGALQSPAPSANILAMEILGKAAATPAEVAILSVSTPLVTGFLSCWLSSPDVGVGERGIKVLEALLETDCPAPSKDIGDGDSTQLAKRRAPGHGKLWRRLFQDRDVFGLLIELLEGQHFDSTTQPQQQSLAHGRILRLVPALARINLAGITQCGLPELLPKGGRAGGQTAGPDSLLHYVTLRMVDMEDPLMRLSLVDFIETLVLELRSSEYSPAKVETLRGLLRDATALDRSLTETLRTLPNRTEEAEVMMEWVNEVLPASATRVQ